MHVLCGLPSVPAFVWHSRSKRYPYCCMLQNGQTPKDVAQKAGHMSVVRLLAGPDTYQQNLDSSLGGQVTLHHVDTAYTTLSC